MSDRVAVSHALAVADLLTAARTDRRPVLDDAVRISDHLTVLARMAGLATLPAPRAVLRTLLAHIGRVTRGRQGTRNLKARGGCRWSTRWQNRTDRCEHSSSSSSAEGVQRELQHVEATDAEAIVLDLSGLTFMDSTGVRLIVNADARSRADADRLTLLRAPADVQRVFALTCLEQRLPFAD
jgi:anti-anti-sigma factor